MRPLHPTDPARIGGYRILGRLGAGGMGVVLLGRSSGGALAAVKLVRAEYADDPGFRVRFRREVAVARRVHSRWAVPVVDADTEAPAPWLATEFVPGPPLSDAVARAGGLPADSVRFLGARLAEALGAVHEAGLVHRDVKPANVLLATDGPRLIDFGIARALDDTVLTATDVVIGSPGFLSPEQAQGGHVGPPSDIFSLGCVLAYAATGRRPFGSGPVEAMLFRTVHDAADTAGVPDGLLPAITACLAKTPGDRPTAAQLRDALAQDAPGPWLPGGLLQLIAERSAQMLRLPDIEPTLATAPAAPPGPADTSPADSPPADSPPADTSPGDTSPARPRRRTLLAAAAATLVAGGTTTAWLLGETDRPGGRGAGPARPTLAIGLQADLSGPGQSVGRAQRDGALLAVEELSADKGQPFTFRLDEADDRGAAGPAAAAAARFAADPTVVAVLAATATAAVTAVLTPYDQAGLPVLTANDGDTTHVSRVYTCLRPNNAYQMRPVVEYLTARERGSTLVVDDGTPYGWQTTRFLSEALRAGRRPMTTATVAADADHGDLAREAVRTAAGVVLYGGGPSGAARLAAALSAAGHRGRVLATQAVHDPRFLREAGASAEGWLLVSTAVDPAAAPAPPAARAFDTAFRARHGGPAPLYAAEAYDAVHLLARCARDLGRPQVGRGDLLPTLRGTTHQGVSKAYAFERANGTYTGDGLFFYEVASGRFRLLGTRSATWPA
ncbi:bifunctional serine/threonine-protein kinase/ABC transporter substrate-binding protein [Streptomyces sp. IBSNAI002]|uniref:bifunctional serine/threonine-protein kinase/ABC transporter substrate-binding protein n=1 Tax=Streptomyces sp. IBSNAI002 TaxID=3457500 RepID=UPI003FD31153